jgi:hypothetical protein
MSSIGLYYSLGFYQFDLSVDGDIAGAALNKGLADKLIGRW